MAESLADQVARLRLMALGDPKWDLSPNDQAAITAALDKLSALDTERAAKRQFANALMDLVEVGRWLAQRQPAAHAKDQAEADAWAKFYKLLDEAPVSFQADLDAAVKRAQDRSGGTDA